MSLKRQRSRALQAHEEAMANLSPEEREQRQKRSKELWRQEGPEPVPRTPSESLRLLAEVLDSLPPDE